MRRLVVLGLSFLIASCGGSSQPPSDAASAGSDAFSPQVAAASVAVSTTRRLVGGMYVDTDPAGVAAQVYRLYRAAFNREADASGLGYHVGHIEILRNTLQQIAANFVASPEFAATYGSLRDVEFVTLLYNNVLHRAPEPQGLAFWMNALATGTSRADVLLGFSESNENKGQTAASIAAGVQFIPWPNGRVYVTDGNYFEADASGTAAQVFRLYQAAFARTPDTEGFGYQVGQMEIVGLTLDQLARNFIASAEFSERYGSLGDTDFITQLYANVLHRDPDGGGLQFWLNALATGTPRSQVLTGFSESAENRRNTLASVFAGMRFQPWPTAPSMPMVATPTGVTGTAAIGDPLAGATITLKDSLNLSAVTTTEADGRFRIDTSGLTPPFLLRASTGGSPLYSVSATSANSGTINVTSLTDTVVRSWYLMKNQSVETAFGATDTMPAPSPQQAASILQTLSPVLQLGAQAHGATIATGQDIVSLPFLADGTGMDALLRGTVVNSRVGGFDLQITAGDAMQLTSWTIDTVAGTITASTTATRGGDTSTSLIVGFVPVLPAQATAVDGISALLANVSALVASKNGAITASDLLPYFDPGLLHEGGDRASYVADIASSLQGVQTATFSLQRVFALDTAAGTAGAVVDLTLTAGSQSQSSPRTLHFSFVNGSWLVSGDGRIARIGLQAEARRNQGQSPGGNGPSVNLDVRPPKDAVTAVSASASFGIPAFQRGATEVQGDGSKLDVFVSNTGVLATPLPAAGTAVTFTLARAVGGDIQYTIPINTWTTELISITQPTGTSIAAGPLDLQWTLPKTYAVVRVKANVLVFTGPADNPDSFQCITGQDNLPGTATSTVINVPSTCNGLPVTEVNVNVSTEGPNGERSMVDYEAARAN